MKIVKYSIVLLVSGLFCATAYSNNPSQGILTFPEPLGHSIWQEPKYKRFEHGSTAYQLNELYGSFGNIEADVINLLGNPIKRSEREIPNYHEPNYNIKFIQLFYDGLTIELSTTHHRSYANRVYISNCNLPSSFQLYLCSTVDILKENLGNPSIESDTELTYLINFGEMGSVPLRLFVNDGVVTGIYTNNFVD